MTAKFNFRQSLALLFFLSLNITLFAQSADYTISGKVIDNDLEVPLEYATVSITDVNDPSKITGGVTDIDGKFAIEVAKGTYKIEVEFISYESKIFNNRTVNSDLNLGTIALGVSSASLDEVVVRAETTQVDVRLDKKIYNIGKDLTTAGGTVSDALNNVPSVSVDVEGGISLRGNENVRILINGKPSAMAGFGSTDVLSQLPADAIERVEVITSPSARYDAEGTAGILNIILRKDKTLGFNGSLTLTGGDPANAGASANINYRTEKFNLFNTTGYRYRESPGNAYNETEYFEEREIPLLDDINYDRNIEDRDMDRENKGFNTNLGLEYYINDQSSITGSIFYRNGDDEDLTTNINNYFLNGEERLGTTRTEFETEEDESYQFAVNYINKFNDEGHQLTADFQYDIDNEEQAAFINELVDYNNTGRDEVSVPREETNTLEEQREYLLQADYVLPLGENSQFEAGYRGNFENTVTDYELRQENDNGELAINENQTNIFDYTENVQALYTQYGSKFGDFSFLLGLRLENTNLKGDIDSELTEAELREEFGFQINTNFDNNYLGLFPTVNIIYELGEQENITLGYNRRINRPRGWFINPFPSRNSRTNIFQGNPNLQPAFSNAFDLGYLKRWEKLTLTSSVYFQRETDAFQRVQDNITISGPNNTEVEVIRTLPINLGTNDRIGAEIGLLYNPADWLRLNGSFNFFQFNIDGEYEGVSYSQENNSWFGRFSSKVSLPLGVEWQTNAFYMGPSDEIQGQRDGMLSIDLALSKDIFNDNATISANVSDLLNSRKRQGTTTTDMFTQYSEFQWRQRQINVSLIYRFNQQKNQQRRENRDNDDEMEGDF